MLLRPKRDRTGDAERGCYCRAIRYDADARPFHETICHCDDCRPVVGAVSVAWFSVPRSAFRSSAKVTRRFCVTCGTSLTFAHDDLPDDLDITIASLDDPGPVPPRDHVHTQARPTWDGLSDGLPAFPGARP